MEVNSRNDITAHPDYNQERQHLTETIAAMRESIPELEEAGFEVHAWDSEVDIQAKRMVAKYRQHKADALRGALDSPYFGRVEFEEDGIYLPENLYIGRVGFNGPEELQVMDWRAPKASVFYESQGGRAKYEVRGEQYYGKVTLKRQYQIEDGVLERFFDDQVISALTESLPGEKDEVLRRRLEQSTAKLKDIVETIRSEQNIIIRQPLEQVCIVQGCAGSGKSTIALHRVSYLLYNYKNLEASKVAVIAPNRLFIDYISAVLPGLELEEIQQFTFITLCARILQVEETRIVDMAGDARNEIERQKGSLEFRRILDDFVRQRTQEFSNNLNDISLFEGYLLISKEDLARQFNEGNNPYNRRLESLAKYVEFRINYFLQTSDIPPGQENSKSKRSNIKGYLQRITEKYEQKIYRSSAKTKTGTDKSTTRVTDLRQQMKQEIEGIQQAKADFLQELSAKLEPLDVLEAYRQACPHKLAPSIAEGKLAREDLAGLCYMQYLLEGCGSKLQHIVVDEAQDLSPLEFVIIKLQGRNSFSILGDLAQGINAARGLNNWQVLLEQVFKGGQVQFFELKQSYRSTKEIVEFANRVIPPGLPRGVPVFRQGEPPQIEGTDTWQENAGRCLSKIRDFLAKGCSTVAVIAKTSAMSVKIYEHLCSELPDIHLITADSTSYEGGISVLPVVLAKGLEFDAVIVWDASAGIFTTDPLDAKLLFVALSRPLHYLHVFHIGELTPLLQNTP